MTSALLEEALSLELLQQEMTRSHIDHAAPQADDREARIRQLCSRVEVSCQPLLSCTEAIRTRAAAEVCMATVPHVLSNLQCLMEVCCAAEGNETATQGVAPLPTCTTTWLRWIAHLPYLPHVYTSSVVVRLPALLSALHAAGNTQPWRDLFSSARDTTAAVLLSASQTLRGEVSRHYLPLRSLLPPWAALEACAQYQWAWERLCATTDGSTAALPSSSSGESSRAAFHAVRERLEFAHADQLSREVLLPSFDATHWKTNNAMPAVRSVAPSMWCLFLRCRSIALHGLSTPDAHTSAAPFFVDSAARRLTARVLHRAVNDIRCCLARNASDMHADRLEELTSRDVPCLVLLVRLLYGYVRRQASLTAALHTSLVRLVNTAVELRNPLTVEEVNIMADGESCRGSAISARRATEATGLDDAVRAGGFLDLVWGVAPLREEEIVSEGVGAPWAASFPRAAAVEAIVAGRVVVTTVD